MARAVRIGEWDLKAGNRLLFIAGPCVIENEAHTIRLAESLKRFAEAAGVPLLFKASYDKANRTSLRSYRGPGLEEGLRILAKVRSEAGVKVVADVHTPEEAAACASVLDVIQTPAMLCRQTDLLVAAARTGKPVNVKKGQFLAPWDMGPVVEKLVETGNENLLITERGTSFGYNHLVSDMRSIVYLRRLGFPVVFDATHSVQLPGGEGDRSGGEREYVLPLARAAMAAGADGAYAEVHDRPDQAPSDAPCCLSLDEVPAFLEQLVAVHSLVSGWEDPGEPVEGVSAASPAKGS